MGHMGEKIIRQQEVTHRRVGKKEKGSSYERKLTCLFHMRGKPALDTFLSTKHLSWIAFEGTFPIA